MLEMAILMKISRKFDFSKALYMREDGRPFGCRPGLEIATMRKLRLKNDGEGFYHVGTRCVGRAMMFADDDKTHIVDQILRMAEFCGMEINTYAVMTNHIHILLHVLPERELTDDELVARVAALYGRDRAEDCRVTWAAYRRNGSEAALRRLDEERGAFLRRMGDLSKYMKELKQWISRDYNKKVGRVGTLWEDSFWSNLLEDSAAVLTKVAYYIDCNAVRAGIVDRPEDYAWCGYAQAHAGRKAAQKALAGIFRNEEIEWAEAERRYGWILRRVSDTPAESLDAQEEVFWRALAIGSQSFILETYARFPKVFHARKRPAKPFVTDIGEADKVICASHKPRRIGVG